MLLSGAGLLPLSHFTPGSQGGALQCSSFSPCPLCKGSASSPRQGSAAARGAVPASGGELEASGSSCIYRAEASPARGRALCWHRGARSSPSSFPCTSDLAEGRGEGLAAAARLIFRENLGFSGCTPLLAEQKCSKSTNTGS